MHAKTEEESSAGELLLAPSDTEPAEPDFVLSCTRSTLVILLQYSPSLRFPGYNEPCAPCVNPSPVSAGKATGTGIHRRLPVEAPFHNTSLCSPRLMVPSDPTVGGDSSAVSSHLKHPQEGEERPSVSRHTSQRGHPAAGEDKHMLMGASGRLGQAVLHAILEHDIIPTRNLLISTSSDPNDGRWNQVKARGVTIRYGNFDDTQSLERAFDGVQKLLVISSPNIELDMPDKPYGEGREAQHWNVILAARRARVRHIYYTSLALAPVNAFVAIASVMRAHERTENTLRLLTDTAYTIIREAPYAETWPTYLGYYNGPSEPRHSLMVASDGPVSWTSIRDLGLGTAMILADGCSAWSGVTVTLSSQLGVSLTQVAEAVSRARKNHTTLNVVSEKEYINYYKKEQRIGEASARWWASTYGAIARGEAWHYNAGTLRMLLQKVGREPIHINDVVEQMLTEGLN